MLKVSNALERLPKITTAWVGCTSVTDDRQTTDGRATTNSERDRELTFAKKSHYLYILTFLLIVMLCNYRLRYQQIAEKSQSLSFQVDMVTKWSCHCRNCATSGDHQVGKWHVNCQHSSCFVWRIMSFVCYLPLHRLRNEAKMTPFWSNHLG